MHTDLAHHDPADPNFSAHVFNFRGNAICIGCTASKAFMYILLPVLLFSVGEIHHFGTSELTLIGLFSISVIISTRELLTGHISRWTSVAVVPGLFQISSLLYVATISSSFSIVERFIVAGIFATPQMSIYLWKITTKLEFNNRGIKFLSRLSLIVGLFFASLDFFAEPLLSSLFIGLSAVVFVKLRKFSSFRSGNDRVAVLNPLSTTLTHYLQNRTIVDDHGLVASDRSLIIFLLFVIGLVSVVSTNPTACDYSKEASAVLSVPFLTMSTVKYCPNCGDPVDYDEKFCDKCGLDLKKAQTTAQNETRQASSQGYNPPYSQGGYGSGGYYSQGTRRNRGFLDNDEARNTAIGVFIVVGLIGWLFTGSLFVGIVVGAIAVGGIALASSTDNCCMQYLILDCCSDCICSIIGGSGRNRR